MLAMVASACKPIYKNLEELFNAPLNSLRYYYISRFGYQQGKQIFFDILLYHYFHDYSTLRKYTPRKMFAP